MATITNNSPLLVIVGETASGKSALAVDLAERFNGEIICADSRTIYRHLDIGTAKPSAEEQARVKHHLLDVVEPDQPFSAAQFQLLAQQAIENITARGKLPIMVGGSGLYIDSVLFDFNFLPPAPSEERNRLNALSVDELQDEIARKGLELPQNDRNKRYLIRTLETAGAVQSRQPLRAHTLVLQPLVSKELLKSRIVQRVEAMVGQGFAEEAAEQANRYGWHAPGLQAPGYKAFHKYIEENETLEAAVTQFVRNDLHLAKRQRTWFKRNKSIHHICNEAEAVELVTTWLNKLP